MSGLSSAEPTLLNSERAEWSPAFTPWDIGAEFRARYESKEDAGVTPNTDFISGLADDREAYYLREKIHLGYKADAFAFFIEGRDASGHEDLRADDAFDLHQAFLTLGNAKEFPLTARIGRQELLYGDERFVGKADWNNTGRSFDAIKLRLENSFGWLDAFTGRVVIPDDGNFNVANDYDQFSGVVAGSGKLVPWQETKFYFFSRNYGVKGPNAVSPGSPGTPSTQRDIYTIGTFLKSDPAALDGWDYQFEAAWQFGSVYHRTQARRLDQQSYAVFAQAGYTWTRAWGKPRLGVGYDHGSGDGNPADGEVETFENLFGTQHRAYGLMDLAGARNMHIPKLTFSVKPVDGLSLNVDLMGFWLDDTGDFFYPESGGGRSGNGYGIKPGNGSFAGTEIDLYASYKVATWANLQLGYGHFFAGDYIKESVASTTGANWLYTQVLLTF